MRNLLPSIILILLGLALGFIIGWMLGTGAELGLFIGVLLVVAGATAGFVVEWYIDEAHRRNRDEIEINVQANVPESIPQNEATLLAGFLKEREMEVQELRTRLATTEKDLTECRVKQEARTRDLDQLPSLKEKLTIAESELRLWKTKPGELQTQLEAVKVELTDYRQRYEAQVAELEGLRAFKTKTESKPDDLTVIKGIGKVYQQKLYNIGITTLKQLSEADPQRLRRLLDIKSWQATDVAYWVAQALDWVQRLP